MYGHCIALVRWIKSAAHAPKLFICNPSPNEFYPTSFVSLSQKEWEMGQALIRVMEMFSQMLSSNFNVSQKKCKGLLHFGLIEVVILLRFP